MSDRPALELLIDFANDGFRTATAEDGAPVRKAGQFANFNSCEFIAGDRVRLTVGDIGSAGIDETTGSVIFWYDPDSASVITRSKNATAAIAPSSHAVGTRGAPMLTVVWESVGGVVCEIVRRTLSRLSWM